MEFDESFSHKSMTQIRFPLRNLEKNERKIVTFTDVFRAFLFLFFSLVSFFGTGNIASLNSFNPKSIQCLVQVFSPFLMGGLLLTKVLIPFLLVAVFMFAVKHLTRMHSTALFLLVLLFSDVMSLHFFFLVTDKGSWAEIGTSLSHFVIAEAVVIFLQVFFLLASFLLTFNGDLEEPSSFKEKAQDSDSGERVFSGLEMKNETIEGLHVRFVSDR